MNFNLLTEPWIPVLYHDGKVKRVGVLKAFEEAKEIRCIALGSPLDLFAVYRFLLTLLYWKTDCVEKVRASLLKGEMPHRVLNSIAGEVNCFNLFNDKSPFLQDPVACDGKGKNKKSAGSLLAELATGTNIAHFHHGDDENMRLCLPCTALGMLRVVPWSQAGGAGLTPSLHNAPPIMAIAIGDNLASMLGMNLVPLDVESGDAKWSGHFRPTDSTNPIPYLEALTWNPRRICLPTPQEGACWYCGITEIPTVGKINYMKNENTKKRSGKEPFKWKDPAAFYVEDFKTIKSTSERRAVNGLDLRPLSNKDRIPESAVVVKNTNHEGWLLVIPCTNPANNKTFDHRQHELKSFQPETISSLITDTGPRSRPGLDGWKQPKQSYPNGFKQFVLWAERLLTYADWVALSNAAFKDMHDSPAAFDVFSGLYWGLRDKEIGGLPSRNVAWLTLKLMAYVPARVRTPNSNSNFCPLQMLPKRQINEGGRTSLYPVSFPCGPQLEAALRRALDDNLRKRHPELVDWIGLCHGLEQMLNRKPRRENKHVCPDSYAPEHSARKP